MSWVKEILKPPPPKPKGWLTVSDVAKESGSPRGTVGPKLRRMVSEGVLMVMDCMENGKIVKAYKKK